MSVDLEKLRSIGTMTRKGQKRTRTIIREDNGKVAGTETDHWDGRVDAVARPDTLRVHISLSGGAENG